MTRNFYNFDLLYILGECNIYIIDYKYIYYIYTKNTTESRKHFSKNKKIYTLMFLSGNSGNSGNNSTKPLKLQQSAVTTFGVFCYHCYHFPICIGKLTILFFNGFFAQLYILCDTQSCTHRLFLPSQIPKAFKLKFSAFFLIIKYFYFFEGD